MFPPKKIICPTDFSEPARLALEAGMELAEKFSAELVLVHVLSPIPAIAAGGYNLEKVRADLEKEARQRMEKTVAELSAKTLEVSSHIVDGVGTRPSEYIVELADKEGADLIVMATHGQSGWGRVFFGSVAERVVRLAECPVLTVRRPRQKA
jgi:nucleotide-binding universal stress UspA family protein